MVISVHDQPIFCSAIRATWRGARALALLLVMGCGGQSSAVPEASAGVTSPPAAWPDQPHDTSFAGVVARLSEPGGYFDTDNLISNEASYLHPVSTLRAMGVEGGAFIGVGPDQNFSYIAAIRPRVAFMVDLRRDNLLEHLLLKALFNVSRNRAEYLALLFGRPLPAPAGEWDDRSITTLVEYIDATQSSAAAAIEARARVSQEVGTFGLALSDPDLATIDRFHASFIAAGLDLRFTSIDRPVRPYYPTYRQLLLERDLAGRQSSFLASEADFRFVQEMQQRGDVIPVVADLAGDHALREIGRYLNERGERVSAFYTSNVEYYLMQNGTFDLFVANVASLPRAEPSVIIRSCFGWACGPSHPQTVPGYFSTQLVQTMSSLISEHEAGGYRTYADVVTKHGVQGVSLNAPLTP